MAGILGTTTLAQVGFIVRDIEATKRKFAEFLGLPVPPTVGVGDYAVTGTTVDGQPAPDASCVMAFFDVGPETQLELIQPNEAKSTWRDFLDAHGEGIHHIAFQVKDTDGKVLACKQIGIPCVQRGKYGDGSGQYAYFDAQNDLKCIVETLESFR